MDVALFGQSLAVLITSFFAAYAFLPFARRTGFVDKPDHRKRHGRPVPLIGGSVVFAGLLMALVVSGLVVGVNWMIFLVAAFLLTAMGILDDIYDLSARWRFLAQGVIVVCAGLASGVYVDSLGLLLGGTPLYLGLGIGLLFSVICALASINAYNMIDGIDGLAGTITLITLLGIAALSDLAGASSTTMMAALPCLAVAVFLLFNLEVPLFKGQKMFLGDGGSTFLGFLVFWLVTLGSQDDASFRPITAVWLVGLPIADMLTVFARRAFAGKSPFNADRTHIHHLLMEKGLTARQTLVVLAVLHSTFVAVGIFGEVFNWSEAAMTIGAIMSGFLYMAAHIMISSTRGRASSSIRVK